MDAVAAADAAGGPLLVVGGGSNLLASDAPFEGMVVDVQPFGEVASIIHEEPAGSVVVRAGAGTVWDAFVSWTLSQGLSGVEALSGIPGTVGASPVQNVGAYGHEVSETIESVEVYDRLTGIVVRLLPSDLGFAYRSSAIKRSVGEAVMAADRLLETAKAQADAHVIGRSVGDRRSTTAQKQWQAEEEEVHLFHTTRVFV